MTVRPVAGLSRIGLRTADGCFCPLMLESFRGVRQLTLTTTSPEQEATEVELFLEEPGGGDRYHPLGTVRIDATAAAGPDRPDLLLRVGLDTGRVLTAVLTGPRGRGELRVALQRYSAGDTEMRQAPALRDARALFAAGHLDEAPRGGAPTTAAAALSHAADPEEPIELFVHRCTSTAPLNAIPYDLPHIRWLAERDDLRGEEVALLRSIYGRLAQDRDPERARFAAAGVRALDERDAAGPQAAGPQAAGDDPVTGEARSAFDRREYRQTLRLLGAVRGAGRAAGTASAEQVALIDYWLRE